jgi:DNA-binding PadR family transcriptional regulator
MREQRMGWGGPRHEFQDTHGPRWQRGGGRRRRGDIRTAVLATLAEGPGHGYEIIQRIEEKSEGAWRPSPGSVYPTLQLLEDEGLVEATERDGKRVFEITDAGRAEAQQRIEDAGGTPWSTDVGPGSGRGQLRHSMALLALALKQVAVAGDKAQLDKATVIVNDARKKLYQLLSED